MFYWERLADRRFKRFSCLVKKTSNLKKKSWQLRKQIKKLVAYGSASRTRCNLSDNTGPKAQQGENKYVGKLAYQPRICFVLLRVPTYDPRVAVDEQQAEQRIRVRFPMRVKCLHDLLVFIPSLVLWYHGGQVLTYPTTKEFQCHTQLRSKTTQSNALLYRLVETDIGIPKFYLRISEIILRPKPLIDGLIDYYYFT